MSFFDYHSSSGGASSRTHTRFCKRARCRKDCFCKGKGNANGSVEDPPLRSNNVYALNCRLESSVRVPVLSSQTRDGYRERVERKHAGDACRGGVRRVE